MKQIRSGQSFLYRTNGYDSTVIEIRMRDKVTGSYLQVALTNAARRFPYLTQKLVEKGGAYYLHRDDNSMVAVKTDKFRTLGSMATGYHLLDVTYTGNSIRVAFHHGLCDGRGVMPFIEALLYDYCCQKYHKKFSSEGIRLPGDPIPEEETAEPFSREFYEVDETAVQPVAHDGFALPESTSTPEACYHSEILLDENTFVHAAKAVGATPTLFAAMLLSHCILELTPHAEKPVICNLAMDLRSAIGKEQTHRNCVGTAYLPYTAQDRSTAPEKLARRYRELLAAQRDPNAVKAGLNKQIGLFNKLDELSTLEEKRKLMSFFNGMVNNTYVISYMGRLRLNDYAQYVESAHFFSDTICGLTVNMVAAAGKLSFEVLQGFPGTGYAQAFRQALAPYGLISATALEVVTTGKDKSFVTASHQAERYYAKPETPWL